MAHTVYAAFADADHAESAAGALLDHGVPAKSISLVVSEEAKDRIEGREPPPAVGSQTPVVTGPAGATNSLDPLGNELRGGIPPVPMPVPKAEIATDLNPAQNDYPRTGSDSPTELASRPPNSKYDWNPDLDKKAYNADYERTNSEKMDDEIRMEGDRDRARVDPASNVKENDEGTAGDMGYPTKADAAIGHPSDVRDPGYDAERAAKAGVTTTTIQDAAKGAAKGVGYGLGLGALAAVASIAIPGVGLVLGGGALAAAVAGLAASAGAGAVAGGVVGYLKDQGVPGEDIPAYQEAYENGGALIGVVLEEVDGKAVESILGKYGGTRVKTFANDA